MIRREEATTEEYLVKRQSIKTSKANNTDSKSPNNSSKTVNNEVKCEHCGLTFKPKGIQTHITRKHINTQAHEPNFPSKPFYL